ncbi:hypothetical protein [Amycolatopsis pigmentata]|uniref:Uncharacterized protein n=1 Tax=Amycolatopsis pigmentata TaxID=450801 RepID=A0ABW5FRM5_9PSEU
MSCRLVVAVAVVVVVAATVLWAWRPWAGPQSSAASPSPTSHAAPPLTPDAAWSLAADLASADETRVQSAVAVNPAQPVDSNAVAA